MSTPHLPRRYLAAGVAAFGLAAGVAGATYATYTSSDTITACVTARTGDLHIPAHSQCRSGEQQLTWNKRGRRGATGAVGPAGPAGPVGPQGGRGPQGEPGLARVKTEHHYPVGIPAQQLGSMYVECPPGGVALGGGFTLDGDTPSLQAFNVLGSHPVDSDDGSHPIGWQVDVYNASQVTAILSVDVVCALPVVTS